MATSTTFSSHVDVQPVTQLPGIDRRTLVWGYAMLLAEITIAKGSYVPSHSHPHEQVGYVVKGRLQFVVGGAERLLEAGAGYVVPSNVPHEVRALEDSIAIDIFSPVREEYIPQR